MVIENAMHLYIADYNYSSWSMRAQLVLVESGLPFEESVIGLRLPDTKTKIAAVTPNRKVPALLIEDTLVWDSLAIAETIAERTGTGWPKAWQDRAQARSLSAEMHSGFTLVRQNLPMDIFSRSPRAQSFRLDDACSPELLAEIARLSQIFESARGPFLFGDWCIADAFFAPVVTRFLTYKVPVSTGVQRYFDAAMKRPSVEQWVKKAQSETAVFPY